MMKNLVKIGNIQKTHGINGEVSCHIHVAPDDFNDVKVIFIKNVPYFVAKLQYHQGRLTVLFEDIDSVEKAKKLIGSDLFVDENLVSNDEYLWIDQIIGYQIVDDIKGNIGIVENFYKIPNNDLLVSEIEGKEILIPANTHIVKKIDDKSKTIYVSLPEGLIEIYTNTNEQEEEDKED